MKYARRVIKTANLVNPVFLAKCTLLSVLQVPWKCEQLILDWHFEPAYTAHHCGKKFENIYHLS